MQLFSCFSDPSLSLSLSSVMNLFGVLKYKKMGEDFVRNSGLPFTIIRSVTPNCYLFLNIRDEVSHSIATFSLVDFGFEFPTPRPRAQELVDK